MLEHLCLKARLPKDAWKKDTIFYTFQADVFGEVE
jgi:AMMECR1 domain-containing protein